MAAMESRSASRSAHGPLVCDESDDGASSDVASGVERDWGGYTGYFADPDGFRWEVAFNPGPVGQLVLPPVSDTT